MANITHLLGALLVMLWFAVTIMGNTILGESILKLIPSPYAEDIIRYKWLILGFGIFLSITGFVINIKQKRNPNRNRNRNDSRWQKNDPTIIRKDFKSEHRKDNFISSCEKQFNDTFKNSSNRQTTELNDLAKKVEWSPIAGCGANFKTSYLYQSDQSRLQVLRSNGAKLFLSVFVGMGTIMPTFIIYSIIKEEGFGWHLIFIFVIGSIFTAFNIDMLFFHKARVFDKQIGWF